MLINKRLDVEFIASSKEKERGVVIYAKSHLEPKLLFIDEEGRIVIIEIKINLERIIVIRIYASNERKPEFYHLLEEKALEYLGEKLILMGNFNGVVGNLDWTEQITKRKKQISFRTTFFI